MKTKLKTAIFSTLILLIFQSISFASEIENPIGPLIDFSGASYTEDITIVGDEDYGAMTTTNVITIISSTHNIDINSFIKNSGGYGIWAVDNSTITTGANKVKIEVESENAQGIHAYIDSNINLSAANGIDIVITNTNAPNSFSYSAGIWAQGDNIIDISGNTTIATTGWKSVGINVINSSLVTIVGNTSIVTDGYGSNGILAHSEANAPIAEMTITLDGDTNITTKGENSRGIFIESMENALTEKIEISLNGTTTINTSGDESHGIYIWAWAESAQIPISLNIGKVIINTSEAGTNAFGIYIKNSKASVNIGNDSVITTYKDSSPGISLQDGIFYIGLTENSITKIETYGKESVGIAIGSSFSYSDSRFSAGNLAISTSGENSHGISIEYLDGAKNNVTLGQSNTIITKGNNADGIQVFRAFLDIIAGDINIQTQGSKANGIQVIGEYNGGTGPLGEVRPVLPAHLTMEKVTISTLGEQSFGIYLNPNPSDATDVPKITIKDCAQITTEGLNSFGVFAKNGSAKIGVDSDSATIINTSGKNAAAIHVLNSNEYDKTFESGKLILETLGSNSAGIEVLSLASGGNVSIKLWKTISITTKGEESSGISMQNESVNNASVDILSTLTINTEKNDSYGIRLKGASANINKAFITTAGDKAHALFIENSSKLSIGVGSIIEAKGIGSDAFYFTGTLDTNDTYEYIDITVTSIHANLLSNNSDNTLVVSFKGSSILNGDLYSALNKDLEMYLYDNTKWSGTRASNSSKNTDLYLNDESQWIIKKDSELGLLKFFGDKASTVFINHYSVNDTAYDKITLDNLEGKGLFYMNVNLSSAITKGNLLEAKDASGEHTIIVNSVNGGGADKLLLAKITNTTNVTFTLSNNKLVLGRYIYTLESENSSKEWWLKLDHTSDDLIDTPLAGILGLFEFAKAIDASLSDDFLKPRNDWWFITIGKDQKFDRSLLKVDLEQQIGGAFVGKGKVWSPYFNTGIFAGSNVGYQQIGDFGSVGHILDISVGAYANYERGQLDASAFIRADGYTYNLRITDSYGDNISATNRTYGFSASIEGIYKFGLFDDLLYIGPKVKATFTYVANKPFDFGNGNIINVNYEKGLVTWLGLRIGREQYNQHGKKWGYYLEAGWIYDTNPTLVAYTNGDTDKTVLALSKNRYEAGLGLDLSPFGRGTFSLDIKYAWGLLIVEPIKLKIGGSWNF